MERNLMTLFVGEQNWTFLLSLISGCQFCVSFLFTSHWKPVDNFTRMAAPAPELFPENLNKITTSVSIYLYLTHHMKTLYQYLTILPCLCIARHVKKPIVVTISSCRTSLWVKYWQRWKISESSNSWWIISFINTTFSWKIQSTSKETRWNW